MDKAKPIDLVPELVQAEREPAPPSIAPDDNCDSTTKKDGAVMEIGGRVGPDPTRFGDWEKAGRCIDF